MLKGLLRIYDLFIAVVLVYALIDLWRHPHSLGTIPTIICVTLGTLMGLLFSLRIRKKHRAGLAAKTRQSVAH